MVDLQIFAPGVPDEHFKGIILFLKDGKDRVLRRNPIQPIPGNFWFFSLDFG